MQRLWQKQDLLALVIALIGIGLLPTLISTYTTLNMFSQRSK